MESKKKLADFWKDKKVFVTGHTGFKGSWLLILLNMLGSKVYGYALKPLDKSLFRQANCKKILNKNTYSDIKNYKKLKYEIDKSKPQIIFHLAAQPLVSQSFLDPLNTFKTNIIGTINLLEAIKNNKSVKSVVIITTDKVYKIKTSDKVYSEIDELGGKDPYSASKACTELVSYSYIESFFKNSFLKNKISTARSGNVIGGGDYSKDRLMPDIIKSINLNKTLIVRKPKNIRPWQHVMDPLMGYLKLAEKQYNKKINNMHHWNFGPNTSSFVSVNEIIKIVKKKYKLKTKIKYNQNFFETEILKLNSNKAKKYLNWKSKWNLQKSINSVIEWNYQLNKLNNARKICETQIEEYLK